MRSTRTYSRHWDLETRQHELLGLDLGEGLPRTTLRYGAIFFPLWWGGWLLLFGFPSQPVFPLFLLPPLGLTYYGAKRSATYWRRTNLLQWAVRAQFLIGGVTPVIGRGRIPPATTGVRLRTQRLGERSENLAQLPLFGPLFSAGASDPATSHGTPIYRKPRLRMYGPAAVAKARRRTLRKHRFNSPKERAQ